MFCTQCGADIPADARYCKSCGAQIDSVTIDVNAHQPDVEYAGFWIRFGAYVLDFLIFLIPVAVLMFFLAIFFNMSLEDAEVIVGLIGFFVIAAFESSDKMQGTPGKKILGLRIVDTHGETISYGRALGRSLAKVLSNLILFIGFFMIGWTREKRGLHDFIAVTYVVRDRRR